MILREDPQISTFVPFYLFTSSGNNIIEPMGSKTPITIYQNKIIPKRAYGQIEGEASGQSVTPADISGTLVKLINISTRCEIPINGAEFFDKLRENS